MEGESVLVDRIFFNGRIYMIGEESPVVEAVVVDGDRIVEVGGSAEMLGRYDADEKIDLGGRVVIPALVDAHAHFSGYAKSRAWIDLVGTRSLDEVLKRVAERVARTPKGRWIRGRGWDQNDWSEKRFPTAEELDRVSPDNPVLLTRICGHAALANSMALELSGIMRGTPDPAGGKIVRDSEGDPTGILIDSAIELVEKKVPPFGDDELKELFIEAAHQCLSVGLVGVHEMGIDRRIADIYLSLYRDGKLPFRITAYYLSDAPELDSLLQNEPMRGCCGDFFSVVGVKFFADGSLGARSAALLDDYSDDPGNRGILVTNPDTLFERMLRAHRAGYQIAVHAIGDRANRLVLDCIERIEREVTGRDARFRIEHAQVVAPDDIPRFAALGVIPSMQFTHATSDMPWAEDRLGRERLKGAYAWRSFKETGCRIPGGSDFPVESINPFLGIYAAVTRKDISGKPEGGWLPEQCLTVEEAVRAFTIDAAYASFEEDIRGSIERGKLADFVVLSEDIMNVEPDRIPGINVLATILGGKIVYEADGFELVK